MAKISDGIAILDSIASRNFGYSPEVMGFDMFSVEMTQAIVHTADDGITFAAMVSTSGMKESESKLWKLTRKRTAKLESGKLDLSPEYTASEAYECEYNPIAFAMGLVEAFKNHPEEGGLTVAELLDLTPDMFAVDHCNNAENRKLSRKHDRSRRNSHD